MPIPSPGRILERLRRDGIGASCRYALHRVHAEYWERRLGIHTAGGYALSSEDIGSPDDHDYSPESYLDFEHSMKWLRPDERTGTFVDCGSGKGRIVLSAARHAFRRAIGVELSPALNRIAAQNLAIARRWLRCGDVEFVTMDASHYEFPPDVRCVFLYNPFGGAVLDAVLAHLRESLERAPRALALIVSTPDRVECALAGARWIARAAEFHGLRRHVLFHTP